MPSWYAPNLNDSWRIYKLSRTLKNKSFRKDKNARSVYTRYKLDGIKQKQELKESLRTYKNPEHRQHASVLEDRLEDEYEFDLHCEWEDRLNKSIIRDGWDASMWYQGRRYEHQCSYLHQVSFVRGVLDPNNTDEQVCVWKEM